MTTEKEKWWFDAMHQAADNPETTGRILKEGKRRVKKLEPPTAGFPEVKLPSADGRKNFIADLESQQESSAEKFSGQLGPDATRDEKRS